MCYGEIGVHIPLCVAVHGRLGYSRVIEKQSEGQHHWGEERRVSCCNSVPREKEGGAVC